MRIQTRLGLDGWQKDFLQCIRNKILCCGRQVGKSEICGMDCGHYAMNNANKTILMIAPTERQAFELFDKVLNYIYLVNPKAIKMGVDRPTKTIIKLKNGTKILCLPTGVSGIGIRGYTIDRLYVDEAARIPEDVWAAVLPMLLITGGKIILLSTPAGSGSYFANVFLNIRNKYNNFKRFSIDSETCVRDRKICETWTKKQRDNALEFLAQQRVERTKLEYAQEFEGKIVDELRQFFPDELIHSCMRPKTWFLTSMPRLGINSLGVDVGGMGDDNVLFSLKLFEKRLYEIDKQITNHQRTTATVNDCLIADHKWKYNQMYIDDGGKGVAVFDPLLIHPQTKRKVCAINNASRSIDRDQRKKKLLKEDLYNNLLVLMEQGLIFLQEDENTFQSLKSIQAEYTRGGKLIIFGRYTHITEALIRAAWITKNKRLNIWIA